MTENILYYGDNLDILRRYVEDESVDLVYLDPPFNSNQDYNVLFAEQNGSQAAAQIKAFEDTWHWDWLAAKTFQEIVESPHHQVSKALQAMHTFLGNNDMMAYLTMMAPRLVELKRVLKHTGSIYLHCDPTASHYLKMIMDAVFCPENFRNEIIWQRTTAHSNIYKSFGRLHDIILYYVKSQDATWNSQYTEYSDSHIDNSYRYAEEGTKRRYARRDLTASMSRASSGQIYEWKGVRPPETRCWAYTKDKMEDFEKAGLIVYSEKGYPRLKVYLDEMPGVPLQDIWTDIRPVQSQSKERLGYPTQKPEALLERIIESSTEKGDIVLDPFCGCGTAIVAAQKLKRSWIGIDITHLAVALIKKRLSDMFGSKCHYKVIGEPVSLPDAQKLAKKDPYQFQWWALGLVGARPVEQKKGADMGIDGRLYFHDEHIGGKTKQIIFSVKSGQTGVAHVRELKAVVQREKAQIGVLILMNEPTRPMKTEAVSSGFYESAWGKHPVIQILTIEELLAGKSVDYPKTAGTNVTFKKAPKSRVREDGNHHLSFEENF